MRGFPLVRGLLPLAEVEALAGVLGEATGAGRRGMLGVREVRELAGSEGFLAAVRPFVPGAARPVRAIYFDKSPSRNWLVAWHQDLTVAVERRGEVEGFGPWSRKDGLVHVQPPVGLLEGMVTLRLHLDVTDVSNGALRVLPGSHGAGRLGAKEIEGWRGAVEEVVCCAGRGDGLLMRPLLLHASGRSTVAGHRRVLHIEYAGCDLPGGLVWNEAA